MSNSDIKKGPTAKDITVDLLIVGSGTGMAAALAAHEKGLNSLIIEKTDVDGGSTARPGGAFWIPANPTLLADGSHDTREKGKTYLEAITNDSLPDVWKSFLKNAPDTVAMQLRPTTRTILW